MLYTDPTDLTPQREEDITRAAWVAKSSLPAYLLNTFPSIAEVFREAKILFQKKKSVKTKQNPRIIV